MQDNHPKVAFWPPVLLNGSVLGSKHDTPPPSHHIMKRKNRSFRQVSDA